MRAVSENKASSDHSKSSRCPHCGRPVGAGVEQCRSAPGGWWCWQQGLMYDPSQFIAPTPRPIGEAEAEVIAEYAPKISDAEKVVDEALAVYTIAQQTYHRALYEAAEIGVGDLIIPPGQQSGRMRQASEAEREQMLRRLKTLKKGVDTTSERLQKARRKLNHLHAWCDHKQRIARQPVQEDE